MRGLPRSDRVRDVVDLSAQVFTARAIQKTKQPLESFSWEACPLITDVSQCGSRIPSSEVLRSMVSHSTFYVHALDRVLVPKEHLMVLGWSREVCLHDQSATAVRDLAGERFHALATLLVNFHNESDMFCVKTNAFESIGLTSLYASQTCRQAPGHEQRKRQGEKDKIPKAAQNKPIPKIE
eukprot:6455413-Amphidinium_carterae.5